MKFDIITIFPDLFAGVLSCGILQRAQKTELVEIRVVNLRDFATDRHRSVDDRPYGGGEGMIFMPGPLSAAIEHCKGESKTPGTQVVLLSPQGNQWSQNLALEFSTIPHAILICGRYEGVDQRIIECLVDREISIGDFVLSGGEIPAMAILDSVVRLIPGALGKRESTLNESFSTGLLDYPQYTRPHCFRGHSVPEILLSGNHARISEWRKEKALEKTMRSRPDIIKRSGS